MTMGGGLLLLSGLLLLGQAAHSLGNDPYVFGAMGDPAALSATPGYGPAALLIILGCMAGAAQVPFHFWLPGALRSTAPLNAFPHLVVAMLAGLYPLARLHPLLGGTDLWRSMLALVGGLSLLFGALMALRQHDLKQLLAYALTSQLGLLVLLTGLDGLTAPAALVTALLAYVLAAGALFMLVGSVTRIAGTCDLRQLGQLHRAVPVTTWLTVLTGLSLAGMPLFFGFVALHLLFESIFASSLATLERYAVLIILLLGMALSIAYTWRLVYHIFFGTRQAPPRRPLREAPAALLLGPGICTSFLLVLGLPVLGLQGAGLQVLTPALLSPAASVVAGAPVAIDYGIWHNLGLPLLFSLLVIGLGGALISVESKLDQLWGSLPRGLDVNRLYDMLLRGLRQIARELTGALQSGQLRVYLAVLIMMWLGLVGPLFLWAGLDMIAQPGTAQGIGRLFTYEIVLALLIPAGVLAIIQARSRLVALLGVSSIGIVLALFYVLYSAPDLALVQVLASAIGSTLLLLVFAIIPPRFNQRSSRTTRLRDGLIACAVGALLAALTYAVASVPAPTTTANFFLESAPIQAGSANVVQAIMLDFRGLDTLGVVTLFFAGGLGIYGLLRLRRSRHLPTPPTRGTSHDPS
jgi:multicomponent Na+:H+ antiporter subunit A